MNTPTVLNWFEAISGLLSGTLEKNYQSFHAEMEKIYGYVQTKSGSRCVSKKIHDSDAREKMIQKLFKLYQENASLTALCGSGFMRRISKHDHSNDSYQEFIYKTYVPAQLKKMSGHEKLLEEPAVLLWMREMDATVLDPETLKNQSSTLSNLPEEYKNRLMEGRSGIGFLLTESIKAEWIDDITIQEIIDGIKKEDQQNQNVILSKENVVSFFINKYLKLISSGEQFAQVYKESIILGLQNLKNDPIVPKNALNP